MRKRKESPIGYKVEGKILCPACMLEKSLEGITPDADDGELFAVECEFEGREHPSCECCKAKT